jgi:hypothetical protein
MGEPFLPLLNIYKFGSTIYTRLMKSQYCATLYKFRFLLRECNILFLHCTFTVNQNEVRCKECNVLLY